MRGLKAVCSPVWYIPPRVMGDPLAPDAESSEVCWVTLALLAVQGKFFVYKGGKKTSEDQ